jgi:hypothetical protein
MADMHRLEMWSTRRRHDRGSLGPKREYHVRCTRCGWTAMLFSRADRRVEAGKHREVARWADQWAAPPELGARPQAVFSRDRRSAPLG